MLGHALRLPEPGAMPARQLLGALYDIANFPANFLAKTNRRGPEHYTAQLDKSASKSAATVAWSPAVISVGFPA